MVTTAHPSAFWGLTASGTREADSSGRGLRVPSNPSFSITRTGRLSFEAWIRPDTLRWSSSFDPHGYGYVDWMGKCEDYSSTCEWETGERPAGSCRDICTVSVPRATAVSAEAETNDHNRHVGTRRVTTQPRHTDWEARCAESSL
jgi:hypothetical protein